jgi:hypothetical protein
LVRSLVAPAAGSGHLVAETKKNESVMAAMIGNIVNNLQITVKNIHVRYEDKLSTPDVSLLTFFPPPLLAGVLRRCMEVAGRGKGEGARDLEGVTDVTLEGKKEGKAALEGGGGIRVLPEAEGW